MHRKYKASGLVQSVLITYKAQISLEWNILACTLKKWTLGWVRRFGLFISSLRVIKVVQAGPAISPLRGVSGCWLHWAPVRLMHPCLSFLDANSLYLLRHSPPPVNDVSTHLGIMHLDLIPSSSPFSLSPLRVEGSLWMSIRGCIVISFLCLYMPWSPMITANCTSKK